MPRNKNEISSVFLKGKTFERSPGKALKSSFLKCLAFIQDDGSYLSAIRHQLFDFGKLNA
ncbi:hypothetical protein C7B82_06290 [Stenomitos frigidus ULC18]|uniref:Uncharacterized protein n=1 Tax=Stenomitos frigidus ULC18 TaxID=2107698 RepID=A0A2T1EGH0_9CYAN|nr:hypothetical protein C7B82_06290 [Stenomitos frigidus ULC18]